MWLGWGYVLIASYSQWDKGEVNISHFQAWTLELFCVWHEQQRCCVWYKWQTICLQCRRCRKCGFDPCVGTIPWRKTWQPTPVFLPGESQGQRILAGYSSWGHKESDMTEHAQMHTHSSRVKTPWKSRVPDGIIIRWRRAAPLASDCAVTGKQTVVMLGPWDIVVTTDSPNVWGFLIQTYLFSCVQM